MGLLPMALFLFSTWSWSQEHDMGNMPGMDMNAPKVLETPAQAAKHLADKQESEFNHRLTGSIVIIAGIFILLESYLATRWSLMRYVWPMCFVAAGLFVLVFSDTEIWPFGPKLPGTPLRTTSRISSTKSLRLFCWPLGTSNSKKHAAV
jgi:hypothetical protein